MKILTIHPKFISDQRLMDEHDHVHEILDLLGDEDSVSEHPDYFRYNGRRGLLYIRHRILVEEMIARGFNHTTLIDRRSIEAAEWEDLDISDEEIQKDLGQVKSDDPPGRVPLPEGEDREVLTCSQEINSAVPGILEKEDLYVIWHLYRYVVMERSYSRFRSLSEPLQGKTRGQVWMLLDLMMEEAFAEDPEERAPGIAYESVWELVDEKATDDERKEFKKLFDGLEPGRVDVGMRKFLAGVATRIGDEKVLASQMLRPYL
jgi:hypothetical protein